MAIFASDARTLLKRLADRAYASSQERDQLLAQLASVGGLRAKDLVWILFRPDRSYRDAALPLLRQLAEPETVDLALAECRGKPDAAVRAALAALVASGMPGADQRLGALAVQGKGEAQSIARRALLDAPATPALEPVLWQLAATGSVDERLAFLGRLSGRAADPQSLPRWQKLARDADR